MTDSEKLHHAVPHYYSAKRQLPPGLNVTLLEYLKTNAYMSFSFVRHPFDRLVSAYEDKILEGGSDDHRGRRLEV